MAIACFDDDDSRDVVDGSQLMSQCSVDFYSFLFNDYIVVFVVILSLFSGELSGALPFAPIAPGGGSS